MAADVSAEMVERCLLVGLRPGHSVTKLSGEFQGMRRPDEVIRRGVPFTKLPVELFDPEITPWHDVDAGRWVYNDHITLGESRAVVKLIRALAACPSAHRSKSLLLEDNRPTSGAFMKGRSQSRSLNHLLRQRAASSVAAQLQLFLPWVESELQPADELSRLQDAGRAAAP